jgi:hypothetical protein
MPLVNIEFHSAFVAHLQEERLAVVLMLDVDALHDFEGFQRLFAQRNQNLFSISHESSLGAPCSGIGDGTRCADRRQRVRDSVFERSMPSNLIRGWIPVRVKKTRQNKNLELRF